MRSGDTRSPVGTVSQVAAPTAVIDPTSDPSPKTFALAPTAYPRPIGFSGYIASSWRRSRQFRFYSTKIVVRQMRYDIFTFWF